MLGQYGRLVEGDDRLIGIEARTIEVFVARCRVCGFRTGLCEYETDAEGMLRKHCDTSIHGDKIRIAAGHDYEDTITARQRLGDPGPIETERL